MLGDVIVIVEMIVLMVPSVVPATAPVIIVMYMAQIIVVAIVDHHPHQNLPSVSHLLQKFILKMGK